MSDSIDAELKELGLRVKNGDLSGINNEIKALSRRKLARSQRQRLAKLANDAGVYYAAFRLLHRQVRSKRKNDLPTDVEKHLYGVALLGLGLLREGMELLKTINPNGAPLVNQALGWGNIRQWNYEGAIAPLRAGLVHRRTTGRRRFPILIMLANALFTARGERQKPERMLNTAFKVATKMGLATSQWAAAEMQVAHYLWDHDWPKAREALDRLRAICKDHPLGWRGLLVEKWQGVLDLHTAKDKKAAIQNMEALKAKFAQAAHWPQIRNCEYYQALCFNDERLALRLYFGTPFPHFKERLMKEFKLSPETMPAYYDLEIGPRKSGTAIVLETTDGKNTAGTGCLKSGQALQRLLQALTEDFYVPANVFDLYGRVYPGEHFNPTTSPLRIHQLLIRLREWLADNHIPLRIEERSAQYYLEADAPLKIRQQAPWVKRPPEETLQLEFREYLFKLRKQFQDNLFGAGDLESALKISRSTSLNLIRALVAKGLAEKRGAGPQTRYRLLADK